MAAKADGLLDSRISSLGSDADHRQGRRGDAEGRARHANGDGPPVGLRPPFGSPPSAQSRPIVAGLTLIAAAHWSAQPRIEALPEARQIIQFRARGVLSAVIPLLLLRLEHQHQVRRYDCDHPSVWNSHHTNARTAAQVLSRA